MARLQLSNEELTDMILLYGEFGRNSVRAAAAYRERYPNRETHPGEIAFRRLEIRLRENGQLQPPRHPGIFILIS